MAIVGGTIEAQAVADPFLYVDPGWEYAQYFEVQQESMLNPGEWSKSPGCGSYPAPIRE